MSPRSLVPAPFILAGLLALATPLAGQQPSPKPGRPAAPVRAVKGASVEGITEFTLPNGLRFLLFPDSSKPTITVNLTVLVGSRHESYGETGMAHLLEHLLFKGSTRHKNIPQELTEHGAFPNGSTWYDRTNYFETFSATDTNLVWALDLEADRLVHSFVAKKDLESEFTVVRNEFELGENDPAEVLEERVLSTAFLWHNYGHATIGARSDIENVPIERLQAFYRKYYQPDNAILVVAGRFDPGRTLSLIERKFGPIPRPRRTGANILYPTYTRDPVQDGERSVTLRRTGDTQVIMAAYHVPAGAHPDFAAVNLLCHVLGDAPSGRLYKALVETRKAARASCSQLQLKEPGVLMVSATLPKEDNLDDAWAAMRQALAEVVTRPPTDEEVDRARTNLLKNIELDLNRSDRVGLRLSEWASMGDWRLIFIHRDRIRKVTTEDVGRVAAAYLKPSNMTSGTFVPTEKPDRSEIPGAPDVAALVKDYRGDTTLAAGEVFDPSPGNIDRRTTRGALPGGLKLALLPKKNRGEAVYLSLTLRFGSLEAAMGKTVVADLAADMLTRGTTSRTRQQVQDEYDRLKTRRSLSGGATSVRARLETTRPNLAAALRLLGDELRNPAFVPAELEELRRQDLASIQEQRSEPTSLASNAYARYLNPYPQGDPRHIATFDEQAADYGAATLDQVRRFYAEQYGASNGELAVVGDFDPAEVTQVAEEIFGAWKSPEPYARVPSEYQDVAPVNQSIETPDKANALFLAGMNLKIRDDSPDYPALMLGNYLLGGGFLNSRLSTRIREKDGISYAVGSGLFASPLDESGGFQAYAIFAPENAGRLEAAFKEELVRVLTDGYTDEEVRKAKEGWLQSRSVSRAQDPSLVGLLGGYQYLGRTLAWDAGLEKAVSSLTPAQIRDVMRRYIDPDKLIIVQAGDFAKGKKEPGTP